MAKKGNSLFIDGLRNFSVMNINIEVLNTDAPQRWKTLSRLTLPNPTYDHCTIALNKTSLFITGGFGQESQVMVMDLKNKTENEWKK